MRTLSHSTRNQRLAITNGFHHPGMAVLGLSIHTVHVTILAVVMMLSSKLALIYFRACLLLNHFPIFHSQDDKKPGLSKMG